MASTTYTVVRNGKFCNCYVKQLPVATQFELRYGAHALNCPVYRESGDPVDKENDRRVRLTHTRLDA